MQIFGIVANADKAAALEVARVAADYLRARGATVRLAARTAEALESPGGGLSDQAIAETDAVLVLGGDGTILATARVCAPHGTPMLPVHLGRFGFLTEVAPTEITPALDDLLAGRFHIDERMMLAGDAVCDGDPTDRASVIALNDIVIANGPLSRVLSLKLSVNDNFVANYAADGIILATPTGSTAYSLSAGGPLVHPSLQTLLVVPICAHALSARPLLLPPDAEVRVSVERDPKDSVRVTVDGQVGFPLQVGDAIRVRRAPFSAKIISVGGADFYTKLQTKLRWGDGPVY